MNMGKTYTCMITLDLVISAIFTASQNTSIFRKDTL